MRNVMISTITKYRLDRLCNTVRNMHDTDGRPAISPVFTVTVLLYLSLVSQLAVNEVYSYRVPKVGNKPNYKPHQPASYKKDQFNLYNTKDSIPSSPGTIFLDLFVVVDPSTYRYHGNDTEHYVMEMLKVPDLEITTHADMSLRNFCQWQMSHDATKQGKGFHYDAAFLITRTNIHIGGNFNATGIAYMSGVCDPQVKCALCEDGSPMILSHTIAHEIGHLLGMHHDGEQNPCPDRVHIMSGYVPRGYNSFVWSKCSEQALHKFLSSTQAKCLDNPHTKDEVVALDTAAMPGRYYDADYQCQMLYGPEATSCGNWNGPKRCIMLKCRLQWETADCATDGRPAIQGTSCGPSDWCFKGSCIRRYRKASNHPITRLGQPDKPASGPQRCTKCNTFPYMDTIAPTTPQTQHGGPVL